MVKAPLPEGSENWETQARKGWLELAILASLWEGQLYGLEIIRRLETHSELFVTEGTIYPILGRLKRDGTSASTTGSTREVAAAPAPWRVMPRISCPESIR